MFDLFPIDHLNQHIHGSLFEHTDTFELTKTHHYIFVNLLGTMVVVFTFFFNLTEPGMLECLTGR
jgi:hypothetical protein